MNRPGNKKQSPVDNIHSVQDFIKFTEDNGIPILNGAAPRNYHSKQDLEEADRIIRSYQPSSINRFINRMLGVFIGALIYLAADTGLDEDFLAGAAVFGVFIAILLIIKINYPFRHRIKYYNQNRLNDLIRKDHGTMPICIKVYNSMPGKKMLAYIRKLNPEAAQIISNMTAGQK